MEVTQPRLLDVPKVLQALADGPSDKGIARRLNVAPGTGRPHLTNILLKLGGESRLQGLMFGARHGAVRLGRSLED